MALQLVLKLAVMSLLLNEGMRVNFIRLILYEIYYQSMWYFALDDPVTASAAGQSHILPVVDKSPVTNPLSGKWTINLIGWHSCEWPDPSYSLTI